MQQLFNCYFKKKIIKFLDYTIDLKPKYLAKVVYLMILKEKYQQLNYYYKIMI